MNLLEAAQNFLHDGRPEAIPAMCSAVHHAGGPGFSFYWKFLDHLYGEGKRALVAELHENTDEADVMRIVSHYFLSGIAAHAFDIESCKAHLGRALAAASTHRDTLDKGEFSHDILHNVEGIERQFRLIAPDADLSGVAETVFDAGTAPFANSRFDFFVILSCNGIYFDRFGRTFLGTLDAIDPGLPCHIHVINPTEGFAADRAALETRFPHLRLTVEQGMENASYFAVRRFQIVGSLIRHYDKAALVADMDTVLLPPIRALNGLADVLVGQFRKPAIDPMLVTHLSLGYYANSPETLTFLGCLDRYITDRFPRAPLWMLDQCAVLTVSSILGRDMPGVAKFGYLDAPPIRAVDLERRLGLGLDKLQAEQDATLAEKYTLRTLI